MFGTRRMMAMQPSSNLNYQAAIAYLRQLGVFPLIYDTQLTTSIVPNLGTAKTAVDGATNNISLVNEGLWGKSLRWDGVDGRILVPSSATIVTTGSQEYIFICRAASLGEGNNGALGVWENGTQDDSGHTILFFNSAVTALRGRVLKTLAPSNHTTNSGITLDEWYVIFVSIDTTDNLTHVFVGRAGAVAECTYGTQTTGTGTINNLAGQLYIGQRKNGGLTWNGLIQMAALAFRTLTPAERLEVVTRAGLTAPAAGSAFMITANAAMSAKYGGAYPMTYKFTLPGGSSGLTVKYKKASGDAYADMTEKAAGDMFNGIDAVRFDYAGNAAYVSIAWGVTDSLWVSFWDGATPFNVIYAGITKYYDNRVAAVIATGDDWNDTRNADFVTATGKFTAAGVWFSPAIITGECAAGTWADIQTAVTNGFCEPISHAAANAFPPYVDLAASVGSTVTALKANLTMPTVNRRGSNQFIPGFVTPGGVPDAPLQAYLNTVGFLCERSTAANEDVYPTWDYPNEKFIFYGYSIRMGSDGTTNTATLAAKYDAVYAAGGIYHLMMHPYNVNWGAYGDTHLAYITGKTDVWYCGYGHMAMYRYIERFGKATVIAV